MVLLFDLQDHTKTEGPCSGAKIIYGDGHRTLTSFITLAVEIGQK